MADMGFMPQVEWVLRRLERPHQTLLFSATLDGAVDRLVTRYLTDPVLHEVASSTQTVAAMEHRFLQVHQMDKVKVAAAICRAQEKSLVFVRTKRGADRLVEQLEQGGRHGGGHPRRPAPGQPRAGAGRLLARQAAGPGGHRRRRPRPAHRGVDVVIHYDPPEDHKAYLHRSGRTARAGQAGVVVTLVLWNQVVEAEVIQRRLGPADPDRRDVLQRPPAGRPGRVAPSARRERALSPPSASSTRRIRPATAAVTGPDPLPLWSPDDGVRAGAGGHRPPRRRRLRGRRHGGRLDRRRRRGGLLHRHRRGGRRFRPLDDPTGDGGRSGAGSSGPRPPRSGSPTWSSSGTPTAG